MLRITENVWFFVVISAIVLNELNDDRPFSVHSAIALLWNATLKSTIQVLSKPMTLREKLHATIYPGDESGYVAECQEFAIVTQGKTLDEVMQNLSEAVSLYLEDEDLNQLQIIAHPSIVVTFELIPEYA